MPKRSLQSPVKTASHVRHLNVSGNGPGVSFLCMCMLVSAGRCRVRLYGRTGTAAHGILINETGYPVYASMDVTLQHFRKSRSPALLVEPRVGGHKCRRLCEDIQDNVSLPVGCWLCQARTDRQGCLLLLAPAFPSTLLPVVPLNNTLLRFRTCFLNYAYKNASCQLQCGCIDQGAPRTMSQAAAEDEKIKSELILLTANLSATVRRKTSAQDSRPSARAVGAVGVSVISGLLVLVVLLDLTSFRRDLHKLFTNIRAFSKSIRKKQ